MNVALTTYKDLIEHVLDYLGGDTSKENNRRARQAVQQAYRQLKGSHAWSYYYARGRMNLVGQQLAGTIAYTHTGGLYERMATLTGATWPAWATFGTLRVGLVTYEVAEVKSSSVITLTAASNPGADLAAGTTYTLYRDTYPLPSDFQAMDQAILAGQARILTFERPGEWLDRQRLVAGPAVPIVYTITGDPNYFGSMAVRFWPAPDNVYAADFIYQRRARPLLLDTYKTGTASCTSGSPVIAGSGTAWTTSMVGAALELSADGLTDPSGPAGANPYTLQRSVMSVESGTSLTVDVAADQTLTGVKYALSDPADVEEGAMLTLLLREVERQARLVKKMKALPEESEEYIRAWHAAREADARSFSPRSAGVRGPYRQRMANMPRGPDVS